MHKCIGSLLSFGGKCRGTAFLISHNIAITSAHCIYSHKWMSNSNDTKFYPGLYGKLKDYKPYKIDGSFVPPEYFLQENKDNPIYDYAFLKISESIKYSSYLKLGIDFEDYNGPISIYGYPGSQYNMNAS